MDIQKSTIGEKLIKLDSWTRKLKRQLQVVWSLYTDFIPQTHLHAIQAGVQVTNQFNIVGCGTSKEKAALEFMDQFYKTFPKQKGYYDMTIRNPLTYDEDHHGNCTYRLKGYWHLVAPLEPPDTRNFDVGQ